MPKVIPSLQVMHAAEQALRQLQVSDVERNAILEAFRYKEAKMAAAVQAANARADAVEEEALKVVEIGVTPFTRCGALVPRRCLLHLDAMDLPLSRSRLIRESEYRVQTNRGQRWVMLNTLCCPVPGRLAAYARQTCGYNQ